MANESDSISSELQLSLSDLTMELKSLGVKSPIRDSCISNAELCESLLSTAWMLINLVHCSALGLNQSQNALDREALLLSEKQSLESKLSIFKREVNAKDVSLAKEQENVRRIEKELNHHSEIIQKQKQVISQMTVRLETQEKDFKHEIRKQEVQNECLSKMVRKAALRPHPIHAENLSNAFGSLAVSSRQSAEQTDLQHSSISRLKTVNHTLVGENLMLRDALQIFHLDVYNILKTAEKVTTMESIPEARILPENIFRLPLSYSMDAIKNLRQEQVYKLNKILNNA